MGRTWKYALMALGGCIIVLVIWLVLRPKDETNDFIRTVIADAEYRTLLPGCKRTKEAHVERTRTAVIATWELDTEQSWEAYCASLAKEFGIAGYQESMRDDLKIAFRKNLPGDTLTITLENTGSNPMRIRVKFVGNPS